MEKQFLKKPLKFVLDLSGARYCISSIETP